LKFKYLIAAFIIIIAIVILVTALLPLIMSKPEYVINFRYITIPLLLFMGLFLTCMSIYFFINYRLFSLLEREDWPALAYYLEQKIYVKNGYSNRNIRLLASSYLVISDFQSVLKLESKAILAKPSVIYKNILIFGAARILSGSHADAAAFFNSHMGKCEKKDKQWVNWFYGFSLLLSGDFSQAEPDFLLLAVSSDNALITGLSSYFLHSSIEKRSINPDKCREIAENGRTRVINVLKTFENWGKETAKVRAEIHIAIIRKYIDEAGKWLFSKD
jgi:hypothetical protein